MKYYRLDELKELIRAVENGQIIQCRAKSFEALSWYDIPGESLDRVTLNFEAYDFRVKPTARKVPLSAVDISPNSIMRNAIYDKSNGVWHSINYVGPTYLLDSSSNPWYYANLMTSEMEYSSDGGNTWKRFYTEI